MLFSSRTWSPGQVIGVAVTVLLYIGCSTCTPTEPPVETPAALPPQIDAPKNDAPAEVLGKDRSLGYFGGPSGASQLARKGAEEDGESRQGSGKSRQFKQRLEELRQNLRQHKEELENGGADRQQNIEIDIDTPKKEKKKGGRAANKGSSSKYADDDDDDDEGLSDSYGRKPPPGLAPPLSHPSSPASFKAQAKGHGQGQGQGHSQGYRDRDD